jgi:polar amino acid transport system substrate-binding protein
VYAVPDGAAFATADDVDREGDRVGVKLGSAYDLFLSRTLERAETVRGTDGIDVFREQDLDVAAGIRQPLTRHAQRGGLRILEPRFMEIRQAVALAKGHQPETVGFVRDLVEELKANGFVADSIARSGQDVTVAPPA